MSKSLAEQLADLPEEEREAVLADLDPEQLEWDSKFWLRPEQIEPVDDYRVWLVLAGRGFGKGARLDELVPTPSGFVRMGDIQENDIIFDEQGQPTKVLQAHNPYLPKKMYRFTFSDGVQIETDAEHQWVTWTHADRKAFLRSDRVLEHSLDKQTMPDNWATYRQISVDRWGHVIATHGPRIRNTEDIVRTFTHSKRKDTNHSIPLAAPLTIENANLPIDPYVLGAWLGDGFSNQGLICGHIDDFTEIEVEVKSRGYEVLSTRYDKRAGKTKLVTFVGLTTQLRELGVLGNKHVPHEYLWGSEEQRLDLLAGLLDTDGTIGTNGHIEFCNTNENIADAVVLLARSLGEKPVRSVGRATIRSKDCGPKYRVTWRPLRNYFKLSRKSDRFIPLASQGFRNLHRMISSFEEIEPVMVRCLTVDSPNSMYLLSEAMVPTHNTRAGSEWMREKAKYTNQGRLRMGIVAKTAADVRDTVVEGLSGILAVHPPSERPIYEPSKRLLTWPNGNEALLFSSESPDQLRGPSLHALWGDEFAAWSTIPDSSGLTAFDNAMFATREGKNPQLMLTTTPKKVSSVKKLLADSEDPSKRIIITRGKTSDNSGNLDRSYIEDMYGKYAGTKLMQQELEGILLDDIDGVLWTEQNIHDHRVYGLPSGSIPPLRVVGVDPSVSDSKGDEAGIVVCGSTTERDLYKRHAWVLEDATVQGPPEVWANAAVSAAKRWGAPIVIEKNQGGALLRGAIHNIDPNIPVYEVWAKQGKYLRAEPVSLIYQQGRVHHVGTFIELESQMLTWTQEDRRSPDRIDALVHALTALMVTPPKGFHGGHLTAKSMANRKIPTQRVTSSGKRGAVFGANTRRR